jgi:uncharacterized protein YbbK (DUF523 family)
MILVSGCLAGIKCRYNGGSKPESAIVALYKAGEAIAVCPEELGGLSIPRPSAQFQGGTGEDVLDGKAKLIRADGADVTEQFIAGAKAVLQIMKDLSLKEAILKSRSPSCGIGAVHREGKLVEGNGVCAALLLREGIKVKVGDS